MNREVAEIELPALAPQRPALPEPLSVYQRQVDQFSEDLPAIGTCLNGNQLSRKWCPSSPSSRTCRPRLARDCAQQLCGLPCRGQSPGPQHHASCVEGRRDRSPGRLRRTRLLKQLLWGRILEAGLGIRVGASPPDLSLPGGETPWQNATCLRSRTAAQSGTLAGPSSPSSPEHVPHVAGRCICVKSRRS